MSVMTEEDARRKWCPASFAIPEQRLPNGDGGREAGPWMCIASGCMAWRWGAPQHETTWTSGERPEGDDWTAPTDEKQRPGDSVRWERSVTIRRGFCGLGGRP